MNRFMRLPWPVRAIIFAVAVLATMYLIGWSLLSSIELISRAWHSGAQG